MLPIHPPTATFPHNGNMNSETWLPTKAAADALGISTDTLKRKRDICGGFLKPGLHWCVGSTKNSPMTWCVERCREAFHQQGVEVRKIQSPNSPSVTLVHFELSYAETMHILNSIWGYDHYIGGLRYEDERKLRNSTFAKFEEVLNSMHRESDKLVCRRWPKS